jgi:hypothetical protein
MDPIEKNKWVTLHNKGDHSEVRSRIDLYIDKNSRDLEALHLAKQILDQQYELIKAADVSEQIYALESSVENALNCSESLFRIGSLDRATVILEKHAAELISNPRYYYLKGKIDGWAAAKVGARVERIDNPELDNVHYQKIIYSARDEQDIIIKFLDGLTKQAKPILVDIGASDGVAFSNSRNLIQNYGWSGILFEPDPEKASLLSINNKSASGRVNIISAFAKSNSIAKILESFEIPRDFGFLTVDIDSFEYSITKSIIQRFRPRLICLEINERIPPPIKYYINESGDIPPAILGGLSIASACQLLRENRYTPMELHYNNLFALPDEDITDNGSQRNRSNEATELYMTGFIKKIDAFSVYPWNLEWLPRIKHGLSNPIEFVGMIKEIFHHGYPSVSYSIEL